MTKRAILLIACVRSAGGSLAISNSTMGLYNTPKEVTPSPTASLPTTGYVCVYGGGGPTRQTIEGNKGQRSIREQGVNLNMQSSLSRKDWHS